VSDAFAGIDLGTTSVRVGIFSADGRRLSMGSEGLVTTHPGPGLAEQDAATWWPATCLAMQRAMAASGLKPEDIKGIGLDATASTVVLLDEAVHPLAPAVLWMDVRAADEAAATAIDHPVLRYSGGSDAAEWLVPKAMWFKRRRPELWAQAAHFVEALDYLTWMLTGDWVGSLLTSTCKWNYDPLHGGFDAGLFEALGIPDLVDKVPPRIAPIGSLAGALTAAAATDLGLPSDVPVAVGGIDAHMAIAGTGAMGGGSLCFIGGTSVVLMLVTDQAAFGPGIWGPYPEVYGHGTWLLEGGQVSAGSILTWYRNQLGDPDHERLMAAADGVQPGRTGLLVLDFFQGNRTPYRDERLRGAILGLDLHHSPGHVYQALAEGIAYGTRNSVEAMEALGASVSEIVVAGGIRRNRTWLKATADILQRPMVVPAEAEGSVLGTAVIASLAAGTYPSLQEAVAAMVRRERVVEPDTLLRETYEEGFGRYRAAVDTAGDTLRQLSAVT
jgi:ribulose kinase